MRQGLTAKIEAIIEQVAQLECIKPYILCGGTALAMQIGHRKSEDLDFMMWRISKTQKPEVDWNSIEKELSEKIGEIENFNMLGFDQVEFLVKGVKFSFFVSDNYSPISAPVDYLGNIRLADIESIMAMKMEVMLRRMKFRDYYDIYCILQEGFSIHKSYLLIYLPKLLYNPLCTVSAQPCIALIHAGIKTVKGLYFLRLQF